jgi:DNA primase
MLREGVGDTTPEQRAALRTKLEEAARRIPDKALAGEYRAVLLDRFFASRRQNRPGGNIKPAGRRAVYNRSASDQAAPIRTGPRPVTDSAAISAERARILTAILLRHPVLFRDVEHAYAGLDLEPPLERLREAIADWAIHAEVLDSQALMDHLDGFGLRTEMDQMLAGTPVPLPACASPAAMPAEAEEGWWHFLGFLSADSLRDEVRRAEQDMAVDLTEETQRRLKVRKEALNRVIAGELDGAGLAVA